MTKDKLIALYARCSTRKQDLESQVKDLKVWAETRGGPYRLYQDFAVSGRKDDRQGIKALLDDARSGLISVVGVVELSRVGRSLGFIHGSIEALSKAGVKVVLTKNNTVLDNKSLEGRALIGGLALAADIEWMLIQERNERGRRTIKEKGIRVGRKRKTLSKAALMSLREQGYSMRQLAKEFKVSVATIHRHLIPTSQTSETLADRHKISSR